MQDLLRQLISDTQLVLKDPLYRADPLWATQEEWMDYASLHPPLSQKESYSLKPSPFTEAKKAFEKTPPAPSKLLYSAQATTPSLQPALVTKPSPVENRPSPPAHIKETLSKIAPGIKWIDQVPNDSQGKKIGSAWKEKITDAEVILLACQQDAETIEFLKTLAKAVDTHLAKAKIIPADRLEKEDAWDVFLEKNTFRLIIASEGLQQLNKLRSFYRELPAHNTYFLSQIPLFPLQSTAIYKQLDNKALLWKTLCQILKK